MSSDLSVRSFLASTIFLAPVANGQVLLGIVLRVRGGDPQSPGLKPNGYCIWVLKPAIDMVYGLCEESNCTFKSVFMKHMY